MDSSMNLFTRFLDEQAFIVLDGGMATELESMGADLYDPLWSAKVLIESPEMIQKVHRDYLAAGADILTTASYQATFAGFAERGLNLQESTTLFRESVRLAAAAREDFWQNEQNRKNRRYPLIAASLGPYGAFLADGSEYHGNYGLSQLELEDWHRSQVEVLAATPGVDLLFFETIPALLEGQAIAQLMEDFPEMPFVLSFSCKDERRLSHGERWSEAVALLAHTPGLAAIGINCTAPTLITPLLQTVDSRLTGPLIVYPNSGEVWDAGQHSWSCQEERVDMSALLPDWYKFGARIIGGCCRTTPAQIARLRKLMGSVKAL